MNPAEGGRLRGERLKCIMGLADTEKPAFNPLLKAAIAHNNFKPFLSKTASFCYVGRVRAPRTRRARGCWQGHALAARRVAAPLARHPSG